MDEKEESRTNRSKHRQGEGTEGGESRRKEERKRREGKTKSNKQKAPQPAAAAAASAATKFHHREVPPRFQQQKQTKHQKYSKSANKKQLKDTAPWHHHSQPLQPDPNKPSMSSEDDGGWSKGTPGGGTGWGGSRAAVPPSSEPHLPRSGVSKDWGVVNGSDGIAGGRWGAKPSADLDGWNSVAPEQKAVQDTTPDTWNSDSDNSPGNGREGGGGDSTWQVGSKWSVSDAEVFDREGLVSGGCSQDCTGREELVSQGRSTGSDVDDLDSFSLSSSDRDTQVFGNTGDSGVVVGNGVDGGHGNHQGAGSRTAGEVVSSGVQGHSGPAPPPTPPQPSTPNSKQQKADVIQDTAGRAGPTNKRPDLGNGVSDLGNGRPEPGSVGAQGGWKSDGRGRGPRGGGGGGTRGRVDSSHGSQGGGGGGGGGGGSGKTRKKQKPAVDLGDALGALQSEPSGWGELPSPKPNENDTGTECWGVPPDLKERLERGGSQKAPSDRSSGCWGDQTAAKDWSEKDVGTNWNAKAGTGATQWGNGWVNRNKDRSESFNVTEAVRSLVDMGFPAQESEKALKMNNNNLEATIGDLLALQALQEEEEAGLQQSQQQAYIIPSALSTKNKQPALVTAASRPPQTAPTPAMHGMTTHAAVSMVTVPTPSSVSSTPSTTPAFQQQQLHTLQTLLALQNPMLPQQALPNPLLQPPITPQQQAVQSQVLQTLFQQQRLLGLSPLLPPPNFQQVVTQQLGQAQLTKQQIMVQLKAPNQQSPGAQQQLQLQLARCNQYINLINQQLLVLSAQQQKEKAQQEGKGGGGGASPLIGRSNSLPAKSKAEQKFVLSNGTMLRPPYTSTAGVPLNVDVKTLPYVLQDLTLGSALSNATPTINPPTSRSTSRLQQLIPGSLGGEGVTMATKDQGGAATVLASFVPPPQATIAPPQDAPLQTTIPPFPTSVALPQSAQGQMSLPLSLPSQPLSSSSYAPVPTSVGNTPTSVPVLGDPPSTSVPTTSTSVPVAPPTTSAATPTSGPPHPALLADIPEFRPGVPWQPRAQATEPAQLYAVKPSHSLPSTPLSLPEGSELKASAFADAVQNSILGGSAGMGGPIRYGVGVPFPSVTAPNLSSSQPPYRHAHPAGVQPIGSQVGMAKPTRARGYPTSGLGQQQQQYLGRQGGIGTAISNGGGFMGSVGGGGVGSVSGGGGGGGGVMNRPSIRRSLSTSGLTSTSGQTPFNPSLSGITSSQVQAYTIAKKRGSLPQNSPAGLEQGIVQSQYGITQQQQHNPNLSDARRWGGSPDTLVPGKGWVPETVSKPARWGQEAGWKNTFGPASSFEDPLHQPTTLLDQSPMVANTTLGSLAVGGRTWTQDGLKTPSFNGPLSPEPTYAEWQAGKKARFPLFKGAGGSGNPPSLWLVVKNITPQVDEMSLREVCGEYGMVQNCIMSPNMDLAFVKYFSQGDSMKAKMGLESNPNICGIVVSVDFISEAEVAGLHESFLQLRQDSNRDFSSLDDGRSLPSWLDDGFDDNAQFAGEQFDNGSDQAKWNDSKFGPRSSSLWNDGNFLSGLSNPWQSSHLPRQDHEDASTLLGGSPSNCLPNGLL